MSKPVKATNKIRWWQKLPQRSPIKMHPNENNNPCIILRPGSIGSTGIPVKAKV